MGIAYYVVLNQKIPGLETSMSGKALARSIEALDRAALELRVRPLSDFLAADPELIASLLEGEDADADAADHPVSSGFSALEGLATVRALATHPAGRANGVSKDLEDCDRILGVAAAKGVGWRLEVDV